MNTSRVDYREEALQIAINLASRAIPKEELKENLGRFVAIVSKEERSSSKSLKNSEKVSSMIADLVNVYFEIEPSDLFSQKLMRKVSKHPEVVECTFKETRNVAQALFKCREDGDKLISTEPALNWTSHFLLTLFDPKNIDIHKEFLKDMSEEERHDSFKKRGVIGRDLGEGRKQGFITKELILSLIESIKGWDMEAASFKETPPFEKEYALEYFVYGYQSLILSFPKHKDGMKKSVVWGLEQYLNKL